MDSIPIHLLAEYLEKEIKQLSIVRKFEYNWDKAAAAIESRIETLTKLASHFNIPLTLTNS